MILKKYCILGRSLRRRGSIGLSELYILPGQQYRELPACKIAHLSQLVFCTSLRWWDRTAEKCELRSKAMSSVKPSKIAYSLNKMLQG
jgi:hypothetical protein